MVNIKAFSDLMRLNKPIGSLLLLWPTLWALLIASSGAIPDFKIMGIFVLGVFVMRSAGCVINDIVDQKFDGKVARTENRPLVTGRISRKKAIYLFLTLCLIAFLLVLPLNRYTLELSSIGFVLAILYPFAKRVTHFAQIVLGAAFAWSIPMAFAAVTNQVPTIAWLLYVTAILWAVAYDSIYALMDREDDIKIGIKSTVLLFGKRSASIIFLIHLSVIASLLRLGCLCHYNSFFYVSLFIALLMICYQMLLIHCGNTPSHYYRAFCNNHWLGCIVFLGIALNCHL
jgi:4-hydroxybenzoate polyprenyltransferase